MVKRILAITLVLVMALSFSACGEKYSVKNLPEYSQKEFGLSGFWAPYDISVEGLQKYKDAGFNTLAMINHSLGRTSEEQFYFGSERTMTALENCKKVGLNAILNYNDWIAESSEEEGADYYGETPFSKHDVYGEYKDIITGIHICDEPKDTHYPIYGNETLVNDFKKVYPDKNYIVNLIPITATAGAYGFSTYQDMLDTYAETFLKPFDKPLISIDFYPFHTRHKDGDEYLASNYEMIAKTAKEYNAEQTFIIQASTSQEFEDTLSEADMRWQAYSAIAFGADNLQYYCYSVPRSYDEDGNITYMYDRCILNQDDTPSEIYYHIQKVHKEIQSFASVILSYDWDASLGIVGAKETTYRVSGLMFNEFENAKHYVSASAEQDLIISRFTSDTYGEGYMFVNFADRENSNAVNAQFKDCGAVAIYGGEGYDGTPEIVQLDEEGKLPLELAYGEGVFITPLGQ